MTKSRAIQCVVAFGIAWLLQVGVCFAEMDWFDRASGPGPFKGFFLHYRFLGVAKVDEDVHFVPLAPWDRTATALNLPVDGVRKAR